MNETVDHISSLPDDLLTHILSFLRTREAVQTCILSKRWRNTWASVPVLNFEFDYFSTNERSVQRRKFNKFVNGVFENRESSHLETIIYNANFRDTLLEPSMKWLDRAVLLMPRVISFYASIIESDFPHSVFSCASLQKLDLSFTVTEITIRPQAIVLPSLKILKLHNLCLDDDFTQKIFMGCSALESLKLSVCSLLISGISSNVLKKLELVMCWHSGHIRISCPGLVSLSIDSPMNTNISSISLENMISLVNAEISDLSPATGLELRFGYFTELKKKQWEKDICKFRSFNNLKSLKIGCWDMTKDFNSVACFLKHSPALQELTLHLKLTESGSDTQEEPRKKVCFQVEYLETVNIYCRESDTLAYKLLCMLGRNIKTIGNINIYQVGFIHLSFSNFHFITE